MARTNDITKKDIEVMRIIDALPKDENGMTTVKLADIKPDDMSMGEFRETLLFIQNREITPEERDEILSALQEQ